MKSRLCKRLGIEFPLFGFSHCRDVVAEVSKAGGFGVLALVYGGFSYTKDTQHTKLGPIEFTVKDQERVNVPVWVGVGAVAIGTVLLLLRGRKS